MEILNLTTPSNRHRTLVHIDNIEEENSVKSLTIGINKINVKLIEGRIVKEKKNLIQIETEYTNIIELSKKELETIEEINGKNYRDGSKIVIFIYEDETYKNDQFINITSFYKKQKIRSEDIFTEYKILKILHYRQDTSIRGILIGKSRNRKINYKYRGVKIGIGGKICIIKKEIGLYAIDLMNLKDILET